MHEWEHKDEWKRSSNNFVVSVTRHSESVKSYEGKNRWCVYAYIYPNHPYFEKIDQTGATYQDALTTMPLHCGASLFACPMYGGKVTSIKVGADYNHYKDDYFTYYNTKEEAYEVFKDADELFEWLEYRQQKGQ